MANAQADDPQALADACALVKTAPLQPVTRSKLLNFARFMAGQLLPSQRKAALTFMRDMVNKARGTPAMVAHIDDLYSCLHQTREEKLALCQKLFVALDFAAQVTLVDDIQVMENESTLQYNG